MSLNTLTKQCWQMPNKYDDLYMDIAGRLAQQSFAERVKVGAVLVKNNQIISEGWNGTPSGFPNECEDYAYLDHGSEHPIMSTTKKEVLHAESNALMKVAKSTQSSDGATLYTTLSPCFECSKLLVQAGVKRVVYRDNYRDLTPISFLTTCEVEIEQYEREVPVGRTSSTKDDYRMFTQ